MDLSIESIWRRRSVRTYTGQRLTEVDRNSLLAAIEDSGKTPFGSRIRFALLEAEEGHAAAPMGTYGFITRAPAFVVGIVSVTEGSMEDFGYAMEGIALRATEIGLGSCWLGGTFDRKKARQLLGVKDDEAIVASLAVGYRAERRTLQDQLIYGVAAGSPDKRRRKGNEELFFSVAEDGTWIPLAANEVPGEGGMGFSPQLLEAIRVAPSASNKQPWRVAFLDGLIHMFLAEDRLYNSTFGPVKLQNVDIGIAMRHVDVACLQLGMTPTAVWEKRVPPSIPGGTGRIYIASRAIV